MKRRILIVGAGQCGGNIANGLAEKGYLAYAINTSGEDLNSASSISDDFKYHIPNSGGCGGNRNKSKQLMKHSYKHISDIVISDFSSQDIIYFATSLGGGTGSGLTPLMLKYLSNNYPEKHFGAIVVLPSIKESMEEQSNAIEAYNELKRIPNLKNLFILDNEYFDNKIVNDKFVEMFDNLITLNKHIGDKNIDKGDIEKILTCKGTVIMSNIDHRKDFFNRYGEEMIKDNIFTSFKKGCDYIAISRYKGDKVDIDSLKGTFGEPKRLYQNTNNKETFIVVAGMPMTNGRIDNLANKVETLHNIREEKVSDEEIVRVPKSKTESNSVKNDKKDFEDIFGDFLEE